MDSYLDVLRIQSLVFRMLTFILLCFASALIVTALYNQFNEPESIVAWFPFCASNIIFKIRLRFLSKPLYECLICMSSIWGGLFFLCGAALFAKEYLSLLYAIFAIPVIGGMLTLISVYYFMRDIDDGSTRI